MFFREILDLLRSKTKQEWTELARHRIVLLRIWLQENGEVASFVSLIAGIMIVLFFKLFVFLIVFGGLVAYTIWQLAGSE